MLTAAFKNPEHLTQSVDRLWAEITECELNLQESSQKNKRSDKKNTRKQLQEIATAKNDLIRIRSIIEDEKDLVVQIQSRKLPLFNNQSEIIQRIHQHCDKLTRKAEELTDELQQYLPLLERSTCDNMNFFDKWRAKKVRKIKYRLKSASIREEQRKIRLDQYSKRLLNALDLPIKLSKNEESFLQLQKFARNCFETIQDLKNCQKTWKEERRQLLFMKNWLHESRDKASRRFPEPPPKVFQIQAINSKVRKDELEDYLSLKHRLTVAKTYLRHCLKKIELMPDETPWQ